MNGHARDDGTEDDHTVVSFRPPVAARRVKPANDNKPPLARRIFRVLWIATAALTVGWILWANYR